MIYSGNVTLPQIVNGSVFMLMYDGKEPSDLKPESAPYPIARVRFEAVDWDNETGAVYFEQAGEARIIESGRLTFYRLLLMGHGFIAQGPVGKVGSGVGVEMDRQTVAYGQLLTFTKTVFACPRWAVQ